MPSRPGKVKENWKFCLSHGKVIEFQIFLKICFSWMLKFLLFNQMTILTENNHHFVLKRLCFIIIVISLQKWNTGTKYYKACISWQFWGRGIGHFQVVLYMYLFFKARLRAKHIWKWVLSACEWKLKTRFGKEVHVQNNLEMAYSMTSKLPADRGLIILTLVAIFHFWNDITIIIKHNHFKTKWWLFSVKIVIWLKRRNFNYF